MRCAGLLRSGAARSGGLVACESFARGAVRITGKVALSSVPVTKSRSPCWGRVSGVMKIVSFAQHHGQPALAGLLFFCCNPGVCNPAAMWAAKAAQAQQRVHSMAQPMYGFAAQGALATVDTGDESGVVSWERG